MGFLDRQTQQSAILKLVLRKAIHNPARILEKHWSKPQGNCGLFADPIFKPNLYDWQTRELAVQAAR